MDEMEDEGRDLIGVCSVEDDYAAQGVANLSKSGSVLLSGSVGVHPACDLDKNPIPLLQRCSTTNLLPKVKNTIHTCILSTYSRYLPSQRDQTKRGSLM